MDPWSHVDDSHSTATPQDAPSPAGTATATVERLALPALPPPVRARRFAPGATPPPPSPTTAAVALRRSPQASANPTQLLGPVAVVAAAPKSTKRALLILGVVMVVGLVITAILVGGLLKNTTIVNNLERGDCVSDFFQEGADGEYVEVFLVQTTPCTEAHALEVYAVTELLWSEQDYPGVEESFNEGQNWCFQQYDSFVGGDYDTSPYDVWTFVPIEGSWAQGDRTVQCLVGEYDAVTLTTGSLEGAGW